jgi:hypothetical protein
MTLSKVSLRPGINRETTSYANEGGWFDCDKVRFRSGYPEKIGGWAKLSDEQYLGSARALHPFVALDGTQYIGVGTNLKYYVEQGGGYNDITPLRATTAAGDVTFSASSGSATITVSDTAHGAIENDFVTFSGAVSLGGNVTADILNQNHQVTSVINSDSYEIEVSVTANGSDSGNGGGSVVGAYEINTGLDTSIVLNGWGTGAWSRGAWGSGSNLNTVTDILRLWSHDNFGEDLIINVRNGGIYYWDESDSSPGNFQRAVELQNLTGADPTTPTVAKQVIVSDQDRHVILFGCDPRDDIGTEDPLLIRFSDQEDPTTWDPTATNTAGDLRISNGSEIIAAIETRQQILVWTDVSLHAMQFLGPPFTFGIDQISENTTIMSPNSAVAIDDLVFWMGVNQFYSYSGRVEPLPCSVKQFVFNDFNLGQKQKVFGSLNSAFNEVWWFYPSAESDDIDRYVVFNYEEKVWYYGSLARTAWIDRGISDFPIAAGGGYLYEHENGLNDDGSAMAAYIESSQMDIEDGEHFTFIRRVLPDFTFVGSTAASPVVDLTMKVRNFPGGNYLNSDESAVTRSSTVPVEQFTNQIFTRLRGRSMAIRAESDTTDVAWRLGAPRIDIRRDGRR